MYIKYFICNYGLPGTTVAEAVGPVHVPAELEGHVDGDTFIRADWEASWARSSVVSTSTTSMAGRCGMP
jgi:hypothetical protein